MSTAEIQACNLLLDRNFFNKPCTLEDFSSRQVEKGLAVGSIYRSAAAGTIGRAEIEPAWLLDRVGFGLRGKQYRWRSGQADGQWGGPFYPGREYS